MDPVVRLGSIIATCAEAAGLREVRSPLDSRIARWAPVPVRLIVGYGFMEHGFAKPGRGPDDLPGFFGPVITGERRPSDAP